MTRKLLSLFLILSLTGCGYTTGTLLPAKYRKIAVLPFANKVNNIDENTSSMIYVPGLETQVTTSIIDRFLFDGNLHIAPKDHADMILSGSLIEIGQDELRQDQNFNVQEYRIRIVVSLVMRDSTGKLLWKEPSFTGETTYFLTGPQAQSQSSAIDQALTDLASRVVDRTVENW